MPRATHERLAEEMPGAADHLATFRVEVAERFRVLEKDRQVFRSGTASRIIRALGLRLLGGVSGLVLATTTGYARSGRPASTVLTEVEQPGRSLDEIESRPNAWQRRLDIRRGRSAPGPGVTLRAPGRPVRPPGSDRSGGRTAGAGIGHRP